MRISSIFETHFNSALGQKGKIPRIAKPQIIPCVAEMGKCYFRDHESWSCCTIFFIILDKWYLSIYSNGKGIQLCDFSWYLQDYRHCILQLITTKNFSQLILEFRSHLKVRYLFSIIVYTPSTINRIVFLEGNSFLLKTNGKEEWAEWLSIHLYLNHTGILDT